MARDDITDLLELWPEAAIYIDPRGAIAHLNRPAEELLGCRREALIGCPVESLAASACRAALTRQRTRRPARSTLPGGRPPVMPITVRRCDGSEFSAELAWSSLPAQRARFSIVSLRDITARVEAEQEIEALRAEREAMRGELRRARRLERVGEMASVAAHDLNNLLAIILSLDRLVTEGVGRPALSGVDPHGLIRRDLDEIRKAAERGTRLTRQLLTFGCRDDAVVSALDLNQVIAGIDELLAVALGERARLELNLGDDLPPVITDPSGLEQALLNLVVNARDALAKGGSCVIDTELVAVDVTYQAVRPALSTGGHVRLRVSDNGTGMSRDVRNRALQPFYTTKPSSLGTGLGLAGVGGFVGRSGGDIEIFSAPDRGTTVSILLPTGTELPREDPELRLPRPSGMRDTILLIEDEPAVVDAVRRLFDVRGFTILAAADERQARAAMASGEKAIAVVITGLSSAEIPGRDALAERIAADWPQIGVLSTCGLARAARGGDRSAPYGVSYLERPFTGGGLLRAAAELLGNAPVELRRGAAPGASLPLAGASR